ncbi:MAG: hypothetical protein V7L23_30075 [Nostoc sp.]|uniref:hypothetical protein n=1 Tax=Nostoc sp. TaxID=1180 RepID=UPI002FEF870F
MRLTLKSVQQQASTAGYEVEKVASGYTVNGQTFRLLAEVVNYLNTCLEAPVSPDLTINEVQQIAQQMDFLVQPAFVGYEIFYHGQVLGLAKKLSEVVEVLPQYKEAIAKYYEAEQLEQVVAQVELEVYIEHLAESAPEIEFTDIDGFYNFEAKVNGEVVAELSHDAFNDEKPWYELFLKNFQNPYFTVCVGVARRRHRKTQEQLFLKNSQNPDSTVCVGVARRRHRKTQEQLFLKNSQNPDSTVCVGVARRRHRKIQEQLFLKNVIKVEQTRSENDVTFTDIDGFYNFNILVKDVAIAELSHDAFNSSSPWYVSVSGIEVKRASQYSEATDWVKSQYVAGALTLHQQSQVQVLTTREERALTIEVLEQHGDEFVVHNCENNHYYVVRLNHVEPKERCECADCHYRGVKCKHQIAVENFLGQRLEQVILTVALPLDDLLDIPFDQLTATDWERLKNSASTESMELVAA